MPLSWNEIKSRALTGMVVLTRDYLLSSPISNGFDARTLPEMCDAVITNKELIERAWHEHFA